MGERSFAHTIGPAHNIYSCERIDVCLLIVGFEYMATRANMIRKNLWDSKYKTVTLNNKGLCLIKEDAMSRARDCLLFSEL